MFLFLFKLEREYSSNIFEYSKEKIENYTIYMSSVLLLVPLFFNKNFELLIINKSCRSFQIKENL